MILPITLAVLISQLALADESEPAEGIPARRRGVQIGAAAPVRSTDAFHPLPPLDNRLSINLRDGSLEEFFVQVSSQTKLEFGLVQGIGDCRIGAFLNDITVREALQTVLVVAKISYQQLGRSNSYTIVPRMGDRPMCPPRPKEIAKGKCIAGSTPISVECKDGRLSEFAEDLHIQSGAGLVVWNEALEYPVNVALSKASLKKALKKIRKHKALDVQQVGTKNIFTIALKPTGEPVDQASIQGSTRAVYIPARAAQEYIAPGKRRNEPKANEAFKQGMPN